MICGDIVGKSGRQVVQEQVPILIKNKKIDFVIVNGENDANGFGITSNGAELTFNKISNKSHLLITIHFPTYIAASTDLGCSVVAYAMHDGTNWVRIDSTPSHGPWDYWGTLGYGGNAAGTINYTFSTSTLASARSSFLAKTGDVKIKFMGRAHTTNVTAYFLTYGSSNPKEGTIQVQEVIAE